MTLFNDVVIASGFPVPERLGETGLKAPIEIMAALAGASHAVEYEGSVVLKGFSSLLVPIKRHGDSVQ